MQNSTQKFPAPEKNILLKLSPISNLFKATFQLFKDKWTKLITLAALPMVMMMATLGIFVTSGAIKVNSNNLPIWDFKTIILLVIIGGVFLIVSVVTIAATFLIIGDNSNRFTIIGALQQGSRRIGSLLALDFLMGALLLVGFLLFFVPAIAILVYSILALPVLILEEKGAWFSLKKSFKLIKGIWWPVAGRVFLAIGLILTVNAIADFFPLLNLAVALITGPFWSVFIYLLYRDVTKIKKSQPLAPKEPMEEMAVKGPLAEIPLSKPEKIK